jgi:hypothetical protein
MFSRVVADAEMDESTRELMELRFGEGIARIRQVLAQVLPRRRAAQATLDLALEFRTWQTLRRSGLSSDAAAKAMVRALQAQ